MRIKNNTGRFASVCAENAGKLLWCYFQGRTRETLQEVAGSRSLEQQMAEYLGLKWHERPAGGGRAGRLPKRGLRARVTHAAGGRFDFGCRGRGCVRFSPRGMRTLQRRSPGSERDDPASVLARDSTRGVGRVVSLLTEEAVSAQTDRG